MEKIIIERALKIYEALSYAMNGAYKKARIDFVRQLKKDVMNFSDITEFADKKNIFSAEYNATDKALLAAFERDCFEVACVSSYQLQEKLKTLAAEILQQGEDVTADRLELFAQESKKLIAKYVPEAVDSVPPDGVLKTNLQTAVNSAISASQYNQYRDPDVRDVYPALMYKTQEDSHVRLSHLKLEGFTAYSYDTVWESIYPPNGWNCRCYVTPLTKDEMRGMDLPKERSDAEVNALVKDGGIESDFVGNAALDKTLFGKWKRQAMQDLPDDVRAEIKKMGKEI